MIEGDKVARLGGVHSSGLKRFPALSGRLKFKVRHHKFKNKISLWTGACCGTPAGGGGFSNIQDSNMEHTGQTRTGYCLGFQVKVHSKIPGSGTSLTPDLFWHLSVGLMR